MGKPLISLDMSQRSYRPVAYRTAVLFFGIATWWPHLPEKPCGHAGVCHCQHLSASAKVELANIDPMYQYSLQWFLDEPCGLPQRLSRRVILQCSTTVWWAEVPAAVPACRGSITKIWCAGGQEQKLSARINVQDIKNHSSTFRPTAKVTSEKYEK